MFQFSTGLRNKMFKDTAFKEAFAAGVIYIYSGPQPTNADAAVQGTLLMVVTKDHGSFAFGNSTNGLNFDDPVSGVISKAAAENWQGVAIAAGVAGWFRLMGNATDSLGSSTSLPRLDGAIANAGAELNFLNTTVAVGTPLTIDVFQVTFPAVQQ